MIFKTLSKILMLIEICSFYKERLLVSWKKSSSLPHIPFSSIFTPFIGNAQLCLWPHFVIFWPHWVFTVAWAFSSRSKWRPFSSCSAQVSHSNVASLVAEHWFLECVGSIVVAHGFSCPMTYGFLIPRPGIKPVSLALTDGFLTTGPQGSLLLSLFFFFLVSCFKYFWC